VRLPIAGLVVVLLSFGLGCGTLGGGSQLENTVYATHQTVARLDKNLEGSVTKLNETAVGLQARVEANDQQMRSLQSLLEENQVKLAALQEKLDSLTSNLYRYLRVSQGSTPPPGVGGAPRSSEVSVGSEPPEIVTPGARPAPPKAESGSLEPLSVPSAPTTPAPAPAPMAGAPSSAPSEITPAPAAAPAPAAPASAGNAETDYQQAQKSFARQDYTAALDQFGGYLQRYPDSEYAPNAQFFKARSLQSLGKYDQAIGEFDKLRTAYPANSKVPYAMHQQAVCYARIGQTDRAVQLLQQVIKDYPMTPPADQAKSDIKKLQGN